MLGWVLNRGIGIRRDVVEDNYRRAFPESTAEEEQEALDQSYRFFARAAVDWFKLDEVYQQETVRESGWENLREHREGGAILVSGHFGFWEMAAVHVARHNDGFPVYADEQSNPHSDALINNHRESMGLEPVTGRSGIKELLQTVQNGGLVGIMGDRRVGGCFHYVPFFGRSVCTSRIIPYLARRTGAPVLPMSMYRRDEVLQFNLYEPLPTSLGDMQTTDEVDLLIEFNRWLEGEVRKCPSQYFWFHRRWKNSVPVSEFSRNEYSQVSKQKQPL
jgi:KDO2-lipid IV(A) lauroyltransferase